MSAALAAVTTASVAPAIITIFITVLFLEVRRNKAVTAERSPQTRREHERRNTSTVRQTGHVRGKGLQCGRYETCGNILYLDDHSYAIRPRSGRAARWLLRPSVRRRTCGLLRAPTRSQSDAAGSAAAPRPSGRWGHGSARVRPSGAAIWQHPRPCRQIRFHG